MDDLYGLFVRVIYTGYLYGLFIQLFKALRAVRRARCPDLRFSVRVPNEIIFGSTFRIFFCIWGTMFEAMFDPWRHFGGTVGSFWGTKTVWATKSATRAAQEAPPWK